MFYSLFLDFSFMITPNIHEFVGPLGLKLIGENVYWIASCFKENKTTINAYLHLLKKVYDNNFNEYGIKSESIMFNHICIMTVTIHYL